MRYQPIADHFSDYNYVKRPEIICNLQNNGRTVCLFRSVARSEVHAFESMGEWVSVCAVIALYLWSLSLWLRLGHLKRCHLIASHTHTRTRRWIDGLMKPDTGNVTRHHRIFHGGGADSFIDADASTHILWNAVSAIRYGYRAPIRIVMTKLNVADCQ